MKFPTRTALRTAAVVGTVAAATLISAASASAATDPGRDEAETLVSEMASDAVVLLTEEHVLLDTAADADAVARLRAVDADGAALLARFDAYEVDLPPAARTALALLPAAGARSSVPDDAPPAVVYDAAVAGLQRIADTPSAVLPVTPDDGGRGELVAMTMAVALALGLIVRSTSRQDDDHDDDLELDPVVWNDGLTGVANRRRLDRDLGVAGEYDLGATAIVMIDIDHFPSVTDRFGHVTGDEVLRTVAHVITAEVREQDVVYRYGDEEFCVLLFGADADVAATVAERIVASVRTIELPDGSHVTVSAGLATGEATAVHGVLEHADRALVEAKVAGRDRLHRADALQDA